MIGEAAAYGRNFSRPVRTGFLGLYIGLALIDPARCFLRSIEQSLATRPHFHPVHLALIHAAVELRNYCFELAEAFCVI